MLYIERSSNRRLPQSWAPPDATAADFEPLTPEEVDMIESGHPMDYDARSENDPLSIPEVTRRREYPPVLLRISGCHLLSDALYIAFRHMRRAPGGTYRARYYLHGGADDAAPDSGTCHVLTDAQMRRALAHAERVRITGIPLLIYAEAEAGAFSYAEAARQIDAHITEDQSTADHPTTTIAARGGGQADE